ncbi:MAG TPA: glutamate--tRNA ligase family protein, partial [Rhodopila sp.]|nr:glutamate--tRNA ligase family protein [Rhodopila sp.]
MIRVRFAPTPAGFLTVGGLRVALANDLFRRSHDGTMLLRLDDLDPQRCRPGSADQIMQDLVWFGVEWSSSFRQSERMELYRRTIEHLQRDQFLYPCFESEEELRAKQEFRRRRKQPLIYDRAMLSMTTAQRQAAEAKGKRPYWRLKLSGRTLRWIDLIQGKRQGDLSLVSDPILVQADGTPAPLLASVIDDLDSGITHIIRGEDSVGNTAIQMELFEILTGCPTAIRFGHLPVPADAGGDATGFRKLGNLPVRNLRNDGLEPCAVAACLTGAAPSPPDEMARQIRLSDFSEARLDVKQMLSVNRAVLRQMDFADVADRLPNGATDAFWRAVRGNLDMLKEARGWWDVVTGTIVPPVIDGAHTLLATAAELLPPEPWDHNVWHQWIEAVEAATQQKGDLLLQPLRLALTGEDSGPDLADLLPLIGRSRAASRLAL